MKELTFQNSWENYEFYWNDRRIKALYGIYINSIYFNVIRQEVRYTVYDHGHEYDIKSHTFKVIAEVAHIPVEVDVRDFMGRAKISIRDEDVEYA